LLLQMCALLHCFSFASCMCLLTSCCCTDIAGLALSFYLMTTLSLHRHGQQELQLEI
jgi:hypothetical protein